MSATLAGVAAGALAWFVWSTVVEHVTRRRRGPRRALPVPALIGRRAPRPDVAALLDDVARRVRAGGSLAASLQAAARAGRTAPAAVRAAIARYERGLALADACRPLADDADASTALAGATLCAVARSGGTAGRALDAAAAALRERDALAADVRAQAATARLSAVVLVVVPLAFATWTVAVDADARAFLVGGPAGWTVVATGLTLDAAGALWMRHLVSAAVRS